MNKHISFSDFRLRTKGCVIILWPFLCLIIIISGTLIKRWLYASNSDYAILKNKLISVHVFWRYKLSLNTIATYLFITFLHCYSLSKAWRVQIFIWKMNYCAIFKYLVLYFYAAAYVCQVSANCDNNWLERYEGVLKTINKRPGFPAPLTEAFKVKYACQYFYTHLLCIIK
jgi:hypothetical protein